MQDWSFVFRQGQAACFGRERQNEEAEQKDGAHGHAAVAKVSFENIGGEVAEDGGTDRGDKAADIIAEGYAGATQGCGEEFREINRVSAEQGELAEAHQREHPEQIGERGQFPEDQDGAGEGGEQRNREGWFATDLLAQDAEAVDAEKAGDVEHDEADAGPFAEFSAEFLSAESLRFEPFAHDSANQISGEKSDRPKSDHAGASESEADESVFAPDRMFEKI